MTETAGKRILIVDDNPKNLKLLQVILQQNGYETLVAEDGKKGVSVARESMPDLILMDIQMPVMDGIQALKELKSDLSTASIPIIALTSYAMSGDREKMLNEGFQGYIPKPVDFQNLIENLKNWIQD